MSEPEDDQTVDAGANDAAGSVSEPAPAPAEQTNEERLAGLHTPGDHPAAKNEDGLTALQRAFGASDPED